MNYKSILFLLCFVIFSCQVPTEVVKVDEPLQISGVYPHLAYYNDEGECGTGAVVPWAGSLWVVTYAPHFPEGSSDKLYEITPELAQNIFEQSVGGTPANRMIHQESQQLFIGPHAINKNGEVRTIPYTKMPGRHTGNARHLTDPDKKIYYGTMEEGFYEVDVNSLEPTTLYKDGHENGKKVDADSSHPNPAYAGLPGAHGKGLYSGQGVMVYSNNGEANQLALRQFDIESGALAEWDGKDWKVVRRNQFVEVTGPGGIYGNENPESDPIWATGWDHKSVLVGVREPETGWAFFRLPKASHSYDGAHGWNTEWPRIRDIGTPQEPDYLMTMHGMFWKFPGAFTKKNTAGIRPRSSYLKVIGDFTRWNGQLVFGCDDSAQKEFLNKRKAKGGIEGPGQSNSNLWFTSLEQPDQLGPSTAAGAVWLNETIEAGMASEPFLFDGWESRTAWLHNSGNNATELTFQIDKLGNGNWETFKTAALNAGATKRIVFTEEEKGEWVRVQTNSTTKLTVQFTYTQLDTRNTPADNIFKGLATIEASEPKTGLLYGLGNNRRALGISTGESYFELNDKMELVAKEDDETREFINSKFAIPEQVVRVEEASILIVDDNDRRWRLPLGDKKYDQLTNAAKTRICREVATERDLFNCHGTFYELPAENADGYAKIRPIASHNYWIHDYASYRGLLIMTGIDPKNAVDNPHIITSKDGNATVWAGVIDDLWKLGKPTGRGGPWKNTEVQANVPSDPYLIGFYDKRKMSLSHNSEAEIRFTVEVEPVGHGPWMEYATFTVAPGETFTHDFPKDFQARWIRFKTNGDCEATTWLEYL